MRSVSSKNLLEKDKHFWRTWNFNCVKEVCFQLRHIFNSFNKFIILKKMNQSLYWVKLYWLISVAQIQNEKFNNLVKHLFISLFFNIWIIIAFKEKTQLIHWDLYESENENCLFRIDNWLEDVKQNFIHSTSELNIEFYLRTYNW